MDLHVFFCKSTKLNGRLKCWYKFQIATWICLLDGSCWQKRWFIDQIHCVFISFSHWKSLRYTQKISLKRWTHHLWHETRCPLLYSALQSIKSIAIQPFTILSIMYIFNLILWIYFIRINVIFSKFFHLFYNRYILSLHCSYSLNSNKFFLLFLL